MRKLALFLLIVLLDFGSKYWVAHNIPTINPYGGYPFGGIGLLDTLWFKAGIVHTTNTGVAWGFFANFRTLLLVLRMLITGVIFSYLIFFSPPKRLKIPLTLILAGAIGNIIDFFIYGHVVDMVSLIFYRYSFAIFNLADAAIFIGVVCLFFAQGSKGAKSVRAH